MNEAWIETASGKKFYLFYPNHSVVDIADIAHSLSHTCRYNGHTSHFYSVAEHSLHVSMYLAELKISPEFEMLGLLHDAGEAYVGDTVSPLKNALPVLKHIEELIHLEIINQLCPGVAAIIEDPGLLSILHSVDKRIVIDERKALMGPSNNHWDYLDGLEPLSVPIPCWSSSSAAHRFQNRFTELRVQIEDKQKAVLAIS